jgi:hypothetical protein
MTLRQLLACGDNGARRRPLCLLFRVPRLWLRSDPTTAALSLALPFLALYDDVGFCLTTTPGL